MRWLWRVLVSISALLVLGIFTWPAPSTDVLAQEERPVADASTRAVTVSGMAQIEVTPDVVHLRLGVETRADTAVDALAQNSEQMQSVIDALLEEGVDREQIQTQTVRLHPQQPEPPRPVQPQPDLPQPEPPQQVQPEIPGYVAVNTVQVQVEEIDTLGAIIDPAVAAGANRIEGINFAVRDVEEQLHQAREAAWQNALQQAEQLADLAAAELGPVLTIDVTDQRAPRPALDVVAEAAVARTPIEPGRETVSVRLRVTWQLQ